jgi:FKBP-type peptidyl-prolyl cis-trans isomerase (trigger factor)
MNITKTINNQAKSIVEVQISVPWADLALIWDQTVQKLGEEVEVPGFRKGQAPAEMVEQKVGQQAQQQFLQTVMPQALMEALQGTQVVPIDYPKYQVSAFAKGQDLKFTATVATRPTIEVGDYKTIKVARPAVKTINDEEVNKIIDDLYKRWKLRNPSGQAAPQGTASTGDLSFGDQAPATTSDQPDDTFAKGVGATSLTDLRTKIKQDLENEAKYNNELDYEEAILQQVEKITNVDIPDILIEDELNRMMVSLQRSVTERGLLLDEYLKTQNKTVEQLKEEWKAQADRNVRMELGLSEIARKEGVQISDEELQAEIDKIQDQRVKAQFAAEEPRMHLRHALRQTKTLNLLKGLVG